MDSDKRDNRPKSRADRHQNKQSAEQQEESKTRSKRHKWKKYLNWNYWNKKDDSETEQSSESKPQTRSERHQQDKMLEDKPSSRTDNVEGAEPERSKKKKFSFNLKHMVISIGLVFVLALVAYTVILYGGKLIVDEDKLPVSAPTVIENADGETVWQLYDQYRLPLKMEDIPDEVQGAFVATEDKRFYSHSGVDFRSILRAIYKDIISRSKVEGASTITQQLAKNLFLTNDKSWLRKTKEVMIALYLEREYTKDEILQMYLNVVYFGQGRYGIEAASNKFFDKSTSDLSLDEMALLAGIVNAPNAYSPIDHPDRALKRRNLVLERMTEADIITEDEKVSAQEKEISLNVTQRETNNQAYQTFADMVIKEANEKYDITLDELKNKHYEIKTGFNQNAQQIAYNAFQEDEYFPGSDKATVEGAFVLMDGNSGEIAAALGGRHYEAGNLNRVTQMNRQPGSVIKPLAVYGPALETEAYTPYMMLPDEKKEWDGKEVKNADDQYEGEVSLYKALTHSKNTTAVWLLNEIGINYANGYLEKMGINIDRQKDGLNIALGGLTNGMTPLEVVEAYSAFPNGGETTEAHAISEIKDRTGKVVATANPEKTKVFTEQTAWTMTEMMQGVVREGTAQAGYYPNALAGKTGTTQDTNDIWFAGYTPEYVSALWMGYDQVDENHYLTGGSAYPTELTKRILAEINQQTALSGEFTKPENVQGMEQPIELPEINDLDSSFTFGGLKLVKAKLTWSGSGDDRIIYRIYEVNEDGEDEKIGEVTGGGEYTIDQFALFQKKSYYVVPYDSLGDRTGTPSNTVTVSF